MPLLPEELSALPATDLAGHRQDWGTWTSIRL